MMPDPSRLSRRLNFSDAVVIGLGAMVGTGIFVAIAPAAESGGAGILPGLFLAAFAAFCNATSSAQLAAIYPESGGTYVYARKQLNFFWGWLAGWGFVCGKMASCAAAALTFGVYVHAPSAKMLALLALAGLTAANYFGVKKSARLTRVLLCAVLVPLVVIVFASLFGGRANPDHLRPLMGTNGLRGILQSGAILFFAFAGYARIATLGEEVLNPRQTIPKATITALVITLGIYLAVSVSVLLAVGPNTLSSAKAPLAAAVEAGRFAVLSPAARFGAAIAALGVLLSLILGISRTVFSMASNGEMPKWLASVHPRYKVPHRAEMAVAGVTALIILTGDIRSSIGFSAFTILFYYAVTNAAAMTLPREKRLWPKWTAFTGFFFCVLLAFSLPLLPLISGSAVLFLGAVFFVFRVSRK